MLKPDHAFVTAVVLAALLSSCSSGKSATDKYQQTWSKSYSSTTCADWRSSMAEKQKWVAAADMLTSARAADGAKSMPSDELVDTFQSGVETACVVDTMTLAEMGATLYLTERARFAP